MSTTYVPRITAAAYDDEGRLAAAVLSSPRLLAAFESDELTGLFAAHERATKAAEDARRLPAPATDLAAEAEVALLDGKPLDVAALAEKIGQAEAAKATRDAAVRLIAGLPKAVESRIVRAVSNGIDGAYDSLDEQLTGLLDSAVDAAADLTGIDSADAAIAAGKADAWSTIMTAAREYAALRGDHHVLLRAEDSVGFPNGAPRLAFAYYGGLRSVLPGYSRETARGERDLTGRVHTSAFDPLDVGSPANFLHVLRNRDALQPRVARPDEASAAAAEPLAGAGVQFAPREHDPRSLAGTYGERGALRRGRGDSAVVRDRGRDGALSQV